MWVIWHRSDDHFYTSETTFKLTTDSETDISDRLLFFKARLYFFFYQLYQWNCTEKPTPGLSLLKVWVLLEDNNRDWRIVEGNLVTEGGSRTQLQNTSQFSTKWKKSKCQHMNMSILKAECLLWNRFTDGESGCEKLIKSTLIMCQSFLDLNCSFTEKHKFVAAGCRFYIKLH